MSKRKKHSLWGEAKAFASQHKFLVSAFLVFAGLTFAASVPVPVEEESLHTSAPITLEVNQREVTSKTLIVSTYGNWAFHRHQAKSFVALLNSEGTVVREPQAFSLYDDAMDGVQSFSFDDVQTKESYVLKVRYFSSRGVVDTFFDVTPDTLAQEIPEVNLLISQYHHSPRASWQDADHQVHFVWPHGREDWPDFRL